MRLEVPSPGPSIALSIAMPESWLLVSAVNADPAAN